MPVKGVKITIDSIKTQLNEAVRKGLNSEMNVLVRDLKEATPVHTGRAKDGWYHNGNSIQNDVDYVKYLNEGTSKQAPAHFIEQTLLAHDGVRPSGVIVVDK